MSKLLVPTLLAFLMVGLAAVPTIGTDYAVSERTRASSAFSFFHWMEDAQARHFVREGHFAEDLADLDRELVVPRHFKLWIAPNEDGGQSWQMQLTRVPGGGATRLYSIAWDNTGYSRELSVIDERLIPSF